MTRKLLIAGGLVAFTVVGLGIAVAVATPPRTVVKSVAGPVVTETTPVPGPTVTVTETKDVPGPTVTVTVTETKTVQVAVPAGDSGGTGGLGDGTWTVGTDIAAGTYRANVTSGDCFWSIYRSGTNKGDIVQNDIVKGGHPTVTLSRGQDFESARCGTWTKVG